MSKKSNVALGTAIAAGIGYVAGILTAPKSGRQTRKIIQNKALRAKTEAEHKLKETHSELASLLADANKRVNTEKTKVNSEVKEAIKKAEIAKQKAREILSAIHEGEADDKDLNIVVKDTKKALTHLKKFITK